MIKLKICLVQIKKNQGSLDNIEKNDKFSEKLRIVEQAVPFVYLPYIQIKYFRRMNYGRSKSKFE